MHDLHIVCALHALISCILSCNQVALVLYYSPVGHRELGEPWYSYYSWLQAAGFAVLVLGTCVYDKGTGLEQDKAISRGKSFDSSRWCHLKSSLNIHSGHAVASAKFRAAVEAVLAEVRMQQEARALLHADNEDAA